MNDSEQIESSIAASSRSQNKDQLQDAESHSESQDLFPHQLIQPDQSQSDNSQNMSVNLSQNESESRRQPVFLDQRYRRRSQLNQFHRLNFISAKQMDLVLEPPVLSASSIGNFLSHRKHKKKHLLTEIYGIFEYHGETFHFDTRSLYIFTQSNWVRKAAVWLVEWRFFKSFILICILFNSISMAMENYKNRVDLDYTTSSIDELVQLFGQIFALIFIAEFVLKVIAMGFIVHKKSYMRDLWNIIDFIIVLISLLELFNSDSKEGSFTLMRTLRLLKPLRSFKALKTLRFLIESLLHSLAGLLNVLLFLGFVFSLFAVLGVNLFSGNQYRACRSTPDIVDADSENPFWPQVDDFSMLCYSDTQCQEAYKNDSLVCGSIWEKAGLDPVIYDNVRSNEAIFYGISGFDNFGQALYTVFQVCTLESWVYLMYNFAQTSKRGFISYLFFTVIVIIGAFFTMNLILAQILDSFNHQKLVQECKLREKKEQDRITKEYEAQELLKKSMAKMTAVKLVSSIAISLEKNVISKDAEKPQSSLALSKNKRLSFINAKQGTFMEHKLIQLDEFQEKQDEELKLPNIFEKDQNQTRFTGEVFEESNAEIQQRSNRDKHPNDFHEDHSMIVFDEQASLQNEAEQKPQSQIGDAEIGSNSYREHSQSDENGAEPQLVLQEFEELHVDQLSDAQPNIVNSKNLLKSQLMPVLQPLDDAPIVVEEPTAKEFESLESKTDGETNPKFERQSTQKLTDDHVYKNKCFKCCQQLVSNPYFNLLMLCLIVANTVTMSRYRYDQSKEEKQLIQTLDYAFDLAFLTEMVLKILGFSLRVYCRDRWNLFDALIVFVSFLDNTTQLVSFEIHALDTIFQFLRFLRLARMLKLARFFKGMRVMLIKTAKTLREIAPFTGLLLLFIYMFALLGSELFAYKAIVDENGEIIFGSKRIQEYIASGKELRYPRINFNSFVESMTTVFILVNGEDWIQVAQEWIIAYGDGSRSAEIVATIYFVTVMILGHLTLFALFTGILLHNFQKFQFKIDQETAKKRQQKRKNQALDRQTTLSRKFKTLFSKCLKAFRDQDKEQYQLDRSVREELGIKEENNDVKIQELPSDSELVQIKEMKNQPDQIVLEAAKSLKNLNFSTDLVHYDLNSLRSNHKKSSIKQILEMKVKLQGKSLNLFLPHNRFRKICSTISQHWVFQLIIIGAIIITMVLSAMDSPLIDSDSQRQKTIEMVNYGITILFIAEALLKIVTLGIAMNGPDSYLQSPWNCLDFLVVIFSIIDTVAQAAGNIQAVKTLRIARLLRPIRLLAQNSDVKSAITSLIKSVPKILELLSLVVLVIYMFAVMETYMFSGKFNICFTEHLRMTEIMSQKLILNKWDCLNYGGEWIKPQLNFDSIGVALLGLSSIQSHEGWLGMMWSSVDATEVDFAPKFNNQWMFVPFTLLVIFVICLLFLNLFVGVVIETFNNQKEILTNKHLLTNSQRIYLQTQLLTFTVGPKMINSGDSNNCFVKVCHKISSSQKFETLILTCILLNTCVLGAVHYNMSEEMEQILEQLNLGFLVIFSLEAIIKIIALRKNYFKDSWNRFDFIILSLAIVIMIPISLGYLVQYQGLTTALRVLRVARMLRLFVKAKQLQIIFQTLIEAGPTLFSLGFLLLLSIYTSAVIGVQLFALLDIKERPGVDSELNRDSNFQYFFEAFMTMLRCATGENWNQIMFECAKKHEILYQCIEGEDYDSIIRDGRDPSSWDGPKGCGSFWGSIIFHLIFQIIITQIFLNLFIAIIVDSFMGVTEKFELPVSINAVMEFEDIWAKQFDPQGTGYIDVERLPDLLLAISKGSNSKSLLIIHVYIRDSVVYRELVCRNLDIPTFQNHKKVTFYDTLQKLTLRVVRLHKFKQDMIENAFKVQVMERLMGNRAHILLEQFELLNMKTDYQQAFDQMLKNINSMSAQIQLVRQLRSKTHKLRKKYNHLVDTNLHKNTDGLIPPSKFSDFNNKSQTMVMIYTTRHYFAALKITRFWKKFLAYRNQIEASQSQDSSSDISGSIHNEDAAIPES